MPLTPSDKFLEELGVLNSISASTIIYAASDPANESYQLAVSILFTSPNLQGTPTAPTPPGSDNSNKIATTAFVKVQLTGFQPLNSFLTQVSNLGDPGADQLVFWDDSASKITYLTIGSGLSITGTTLSVNTANLTGLVHTTGNETISGIKTFVSPIVGTITGNISTSQVTGLSTVLATKQPLDQTLSGLAALTGAADTLIYGTGIDAFALSTLTPFARTLLADPDAPSARATLGITGTGGNGGGGSPPGGTSGQVQWNSFGTFAGFGNWNGTTLTVNAFAGAGSGLTNLNASNLSSGTVAIARLGASGTPNSFTYLRGDNTWSIPPAGTVTSIGLAVPAGFSVTGSPVTSVGTLTITTSLSGMIKGTGSGFTTAVAGTDYLTPTGSGAGLTSLNASHITSGLVGTQYLGSGTASATTFLRGDQTWAGGPVGPQGPQGAVGPQGPPGISNARYTENWQYSATSSGDPGTGYVSIDTSDWTTATQVFLSKQTSDGYALPGGEFNIGDELNIQVNSDSTNFAHYNVESVTDNGTYMTYNVTLIEAGTVAPPRKNIVMAVTAISLGSTAALWLNGTGPPTTATGGRDNDYYLNTANGDIYTMINGAWTLVGNIEGPQGIQGPVGPVGPQGPAGIPVGATGDLQWNNGGAFAGGGPNWNGSNLFTVSGVISATSFTGSGASLTGVVLPTGNYIDPTWIQSLSGNKIIGNIPGNASSILGSITESQVTNLVSDLIAKAPLASPVLTGSPQAPTATPGTETKQIATTEFVGIAISSLVASGGGTTPGGVAGDIQFNNGASGFAGGGPTWDGSQMVLPGTSYSDYKIQMGTFGIQPYSTNNCWFADNVYYNGGFKYKDSGLGVLIYFFSGGWHVALAPNNPSGPNQPATLITAIEIDATGKFFMYHDAQVSGNLVVNTSATISGPLTATSFTGNGSGLTGVVLLSGNYPDPAWLPSLSGAKITGDIPGNAASINSDLPESQVTNLTSDLAGKQPLSATLTSLAGTTYMSGTLLGGQGTGVPGIVGVGSGLVLSGNTLTATATSTPPGGITGDLQWNNGGNFAGGGPTWDGSVLSVSSTVGAVADFGTSSTTAYVYIHTIGDPTIGSLFGARSSGSFLQTGTGKNLRIETNGGGLTGLDAGTITATTTASQIGMAIQLAASQTADAFEILASGGTTKLAWISADGKYHGDGSALTGISGTPVGASGDLQWNNGGNFAGGGPTTNGINLTVNGLVSVDSPSGFPELRLNQDSSVGWRFWGDSAGTFYFQYTLTGWVSGLDIFTVGVDAVIKFWEGIRLAPITDSTARNDSIYLGSNHLDTHSAPQLCRKDGAGNVTVVEGGGSGTPAGATGDLQWNNGGFFAGGGPTWNSPILSVPGSLAAGTSSLTNVNAGGIRVSSTFGILSYSANNSGFADNLYYESGWKYFDNGAGTLCYFQPNGMYVFTAPNNISGPGASASVVASFLVDIYGNTAVGLGALATTAIDGFLSISTCAGTPTGVPAHLNLGASPIVVDTTGGKIWAYYSSAWHSLGGGTGGAPGGATHDLQWNNGSGGFAGNGPTWDGTSALFVPGTATFTTSIMMENGETPSTITKPQVTFTFTGTNHFPHWIQTQHIASTPVGNRINFYTSDGTSAGSFPANGILGLRVENGAAISPLFNASPVSTTYFSVQVGNLGMQYLATDQCYLSDNIYSSGGSLHYNSNGYGAYIGFGGATINFVIAAQNVSGGAGALVSTSINALQLKSTGDVAVSRTLATGAGVTGVRPTGAGVITGSQWYDTSISAPVWWNGSTWLLAGGPGTPVGATGDLQWNSSGSFAGGGPNWNGSKLTIPSSAGPTDYAIQMGQFGTAGLQVQGNGIGNFMISDNIYGDSAGNYHYKNSSFGAYLLFGGSYAKFVIAPSGSIGATVTSSLDVLLMHVTGDVTVNRTFATGSGFTSSRPTGTGVVTGSQWYDTQIGSPVWFNGTSWALPAVLTTGIVINTHISPITNDGGSSTVTFDLGVTDWHQFTLSANVTFFLTNAKIGQQFTLRIIQAASGGPYSITSWFTGITWLTATFAAPAMPATAGAIMVCTFRCITTTTFDGFLCGTSAV